VNVSSPRRTRRVAAVIAGLVVASLALSGCLYSLIPDTTPLSTASPTPDTTGIAADLLPFYSQTLDWKTCSKTFQCTDVRAPLDWSDPGKGEISLAIIRARATSGHAIGSLLMDPGGPGVSGVAFLRDSLAFAVDKKVRADYDVIGIDPRGVGDSTAVKCYNAAGMDSYLFDIVPAQRGSDAWTRALKDENRAFGEACNANSHGILPYITTPNAARDLDLLRGVLGDTKLNYLGYSYGTFLGATYAELFPDRVGRLVLDGAVDPSITSIDLDTEQGVGFESAARAYMADCLKGRNCPFRGTVDQALNDLGTLLASLDAHPLTASDGRQLGADSMMTAIFLTLYSQDSWKYLTKALSDALAGKPDVAFILADTYYNRQDGEYLTNETEAFRAYNCMDYPHDETPEQKAASEKTLAEKAPTFAPYLTGPNPCEDWAYPATGKPHRITAEGAAPIVVVGTTNDPATPYKWAVSLADQLSSGVLVTRVGEGHTGYNKGNSCVDNAVDQYFLKGTVPQDGLRCE
jgi:pimeloyl-ACP methyl ester carboxylesterase